MAMPGLTLRKTLAGTGWAISLLIYTNRLRKQHDRVWVHLRKTLAGTGLAVSLLLYTNGIDEKQYTAPMSSATPQTCTMASL